MTDMMAPLRGVPLTLDERTVRIESIMDRTALELGAELAAARDEHPEGWRAWVETELPIGMDAAQRLIAIHKAFELAPPEHKAALPNARTALYELTRLPAEEFTKAIDAGEIHPGMTSREAAGLARRARELRPRLEGPIPKVTLTANVVAQELMRFHRRDLERPVLVALRRWLGPEWQWDLDERQGGDLIIEVPPGSRLVDMEGS